MNLVKGTVGNVLDIDEFFNIFEVLLEVKLHQGPPFNAAFLGVRVPLNEGACRYTQDMVPQLVVCSLRYRHVAAQLHQLCVECAVRLRQE